MNAQTLPRTWLPAIQAHAVAGRTAFVSETGTADYAAFGARVSAYAAGIHALGVARGDFVGLWAAKRVDLVSALFGTMIAGGCPSVMEARISVSELAARMRAVDMRLLLCDDDALIAAAEPTLQAQGARILPLSSVRHDGRAFVDDGLADHDRALLLFTSGSTGRPKGVVQSHANMLANARGVIAHTGVTPADRLLHIMPLHHTNGINNQLLVPLLAGAEVALVERFRAESMVDALDTYRPTYVTGVPTMYSRVLPHLPEGARFPTLRFLRCGSAPITPTLHQAIESAFGVPLLVSYGLSEATCTTTMNPPAARKIGSIGTVLEGQELGLFRPGSDERVPDGQEGEIRIRGETLMLGYVGTEAESPVIDGWLRTGDLGRFDDEGYVTITGRIKDVIIRGGENLSPGLIEMQLVKHPRVRECCVIGAPDEDLGEVPIAFVVPQDDQPLDPETLQAHIRDTLSRVYVPASIHLVPSLPTGSVGKVDRKALRQWLEARRG